MEFAAGLGESQSVFSVYEEINFWSSKEILGGMFITLGFLVSRREFELFHLEK